MESAGEDEREREGGAQGNDSTGTIVNLGSFLNCRCVNLALNIVPQTLGTKATEQPPLRFHPATWWGTRQTDRNSTAKALKIQLTLKDESEVVV